MGHLYHGYVKKPEGIYIYIYIYYIYIWYMCLLAIKPLFSSSMYLKIWHHLASAWLLATYPINSQTCSSFPMKSYHVSRFNQHFPRVFLQFWVLIIRFITCIIPFIIYKQFILVGGFNPSEKYESQIGSSSQLLGKIQNVPNHQPAITDKWP